jgi:hypothetical protein
MITKKFLLPLAAALIMCAGCDFFMGPDRPAGTSGSTLSINFGSAAYSGGGRAVIGSGAALPGDVLAAMRYELTLTGPGGEVLDRSVSGGEGLSLAVALGEWRIDARAYQLDSAVLAGTGSLIFTVTPGINAIRVPLSMTGSCYEIASSTINWVQSNFTYAFPGTTVTITASPPDQRGLVSLFVDNIRPVRAGPNVWTFTMPDCAVNIKAAEAVTIAGLADLARIGVDSDYPLSGTYALINNITLANWNPIGTTTVSSFTGKFYGGNHTITINSFATGDISNIGLFGNIGSTTPGEPAEVYDLTVHYSGSYTFGGSGSVYNMGILAGTLSNHVYLSNITVSGSLTVLDNHATTRAGGIAGYANMDAASPGINDCVSHAVIALTNNGLGNVLGFAGGIAGEVASGGIWRSWAGGTVYVHADSSTSGLNIYAGGLAGKSGGAIGWSYYAGSEVKAESSGAIYVGGIVGNLSGSGEVSQVYALGTVIGNVDSNECYAGGLVGNGAGGGTSITKSAALNAHVGITASGTPYSTGGVRRVLGGTASGDSVTMADNIAHVAMEVKKNDVVQAITSDPTGSDGETKTVTGQANFEASPLNWDFAETWEWDGAHNLPKLRPRGSDPAPV